MDGLLHYFRAPSQWSDSRIEQLRQGLLHFLPLANSIMVYDDYVLSTAESLSSKQQASIAALLPTACALSLAQLASAALPAGDDAADKSGSLHCMLTVVPRLGTVSPWSSQASAILSACGWGGDCRLERTRTIVIGGITQAQLLDAPAACHLLLHDPLTETLLLDPTTQGQLYDQERRRKMTLIPLHRGDDSSWQEAQSQLGVVLSSDERDYFQAIFKQRGRAATDVELMMFSQVNSEHCRHKTFNTKWRQDDTALPHTLFAMIRHTHRHHPDQVLVAYSDNAAVIKPYLSSSPTDKPASAGMIWRNQQHQYQMYCESLPWVFKVETHNHPTAISPYAGAATGAGGEIRDEGATGRGSRTKAGLCGFMVSHLHIPDYSQPWEGKPFAAPHLASALDIMLQGPIGAAAYNNEFGRPNLCGYFRSFQMPTDNAAIQLGFHKPIMLAGGIGVIRSSLIKKHELPVGALIVVLGGEAMAIGLGGGAASSRAVGSDHADLDFASVQRANPEMERRAQEVIDACCAQGADSPILSIHDVGAGGLCNAIPELVDASARGASIDLQRVPSLEPAMSPLEIWCNEAQERFVLAVAKDRLDQLTQIAARERCPCAVLGHVTEDRQLQVADLCSEVESEQSAVISATPVDLLMTDLLGDIPLPQRSLVAAEPMLQAVLDRSVIANLEEALFRLLRFPCVASKSFLITIGDRSVGGLTARDQMVGPWQVPVADVAVLAANYIDYHGEAMACGERAPLACIDPAASARMAAAEAITNLAAADVVGLSQVVFSANWMADSQDNNQAAALYAAVEALAMEFCPALDIAIPVGKDSLSMRSTWQQDGQEYRVQSPLTLSISAAAPVADIRRTLTPQLRYDLGESDLWLIDLSGGKNRLGGSVLAQVYQQIGHIAPDCDDPALLKSFFQMMAQAKKEELLLAYHDRSDGGLFVTLCEMMFAGHGGATIILDELGKDSLAVLANEELGAVVQVSRNNQASWLQCLTAHDLLKHVYLIGEPNQQDHLSIVHHQKIILDKPRSQLQQLWSSHSYQLQKMRDQPECANQEFNKITDNNDAGLCVRIDFDLTEQVAAPYINQGIRPRIAICREQGVNGYREMAAAFMQAGFDCYDVHMTDLQQGRFKLDQFSGLVACGGFSYGDVLGAGRGWAQSILQSPLLADQFAHFLSQTDRFALGVCNGCQMLSQLRSLIPGADHWPDFIKNKSEQFEARLLSVEVMRSPSILLQGMEGSMIPVVVSHGEGRIAHRDVATFDPMHPLACLRYVDSHGKVSEQYPDNPNGSAAGLTAFCNEDGRVTIMMPHPERVYRSAQCSWHPADWPEYSPWMRLFDNARRWLN